MNIFNFLKSHKVFVFGLIFSFCLTFIRPVSSYAANSVYGSFEYGYRSDSGVSGTITLDSTFSLFELASIGSSYLDYSDFNNTTFRTIVDGLGLTGFFNNWDCFNPLFYFNLYVGRANSGSDSVFYLLDFRKNSFVNLDYTVTPMENQILVSQDLGFSAFYLSSSTYFYSVSAPKNFYLSTSSNSLNPFYFSGDSNTRSTGSFSSGGSSFPYLYYRSYDDTFSNDFLVDFESFLTSSDIFSFTALVFPNSSDYRNIYCYNLGIPIRYFSSPGRFECPLATFSVYLFSNVSLFSYSSSNSLRLLSLIQDAASPYDVFDTFTPFVRGYSFTPSVPTFLTPTPIPSPEWVTPTPLPTVTPVPISLTPIPQYINPDLDIDSTEVKSALSGYLDIIDDTFSNFAIFALGSQVLSYLYSFSSYFSFVLLIPAICLIAYAIGRLNQK